LAEEIQIRKKLVYSIFHKDKKQICDIFRNNTFEYDQVVGFLRYHKLDLFFYEIVKEDTYFNDQHLELLEMIKDQYEIVRYHMRMRKSEYAKLYQRFTKEQIRFIILKGFGLDFTVYKDRSVRKYSDIDFLVDERDLDKVRDICFSLGYIQGEYDRELKAIRPYDRNQIMMTRLYSHEISQFAKVVTDDFNSNIDINFKFSWRGYKSMYESKITFLDAYEHTEVVHDGDVILYVMDPYYNCLHLCCHFFNSCVNFLLDNEYVDGEDPAEFNFSRLNDIYETIKTKDFNFEYLKQLTEKYEVNEQVEFVFQLISYFFEIKVPVFEFNDIDLEKLNYYFSRSGEKEFWGISFITRIFESKEKLQYLKRIGF
jgi:hypothetical protein